MSTLQLHTFLLCVHAASWGYVRLQYFRKCQLCIVVNPIDDTERQMVALQILCLLLCPRPKTAKKEEPDHLVYLVQEYPVIAFS